MYWIYVHLDTKHEKEDLYIYIYIYIYEILIFLKTLFILIVSYIIETGTYRQMRQNS